MEPHPRLVFSVKHTQLDFWRRTLPNPTIGAGAHRQIIEACVGNLYGGMGAYPSYVVSGLVDGFEEDPSPNVGLQAWAQQPTFAGVFPVTQGSFSFPGPGTSGSPCTNCSAGTVPFPWVWPWLEFSVLARWVKDNANGDNRAALAPALEGDERRGDRTKINGGSELAAFTAVVQETWGLSNADAVVLHNATLLAMHGNLLAQTVGPFDTVVTQGIVRPTANFMIHNSIGGLYAMGDGGRCNAGAGVPGSSVGRSVGRQLRVLLIY